MKTWTLDEVAAHWDATLDYDEINDKTDSYLRRFIDSAPMFEIEPGSAVLDIDARTGRGSEFFHERVPNLLFTCLVVSDLFQKIARERLASAGVQARVQKFSNMPLPLDDDQFDVTLSYETLEHVPWPDRFIGELVRVTRPGGQIVLTTPNVWWEPIHQLAPVLGLHHSEGPHRMVPRRDIMRSFEKRGCVLHAEKTTVLVPAGPDWLLSTGKRVEAAIGEPLRRTLALRRIFVYQVAGDGSNVATA